MIGGEKGFSLSANEFGLFCKNVLLIKNFKHEQLSHIAQENQQANGFSNSKISLQLRSIEYVRNL